MESRKVNIGENVLEDIRAMLRGIFGGILGVGDIGHWPSESNVQVPFGMQGIEQNPHWRRKERKQQTLEAERTHGT